MAYFFRTIHLLLFLVLNTAFLSGPTPDPLERSERSAKIPMPFAKAGLTKQEAALHLLSRFSFGAKPGEVDRVLSIGLDTWFEQQLAASLPDEEVSKKFISGYDALSLSNEQTVNIYLRGDQVRQLAIRKGVINRDSSNNADKKEYRDELKSFMEAEGLKPMIDLHRQLVNQKIIRAAYSNNQLQEILTDFWFNHFNVSVTKGQSQQYILTYERDAIRPNALSSFAKLLEATAKHPAMLEYLDNAMSVSNDNDAVNSRFNTAARKRINQRMTMEMNDKDNPGKAARIKQLFNQKKNEGLNENYAREIMELHSLGVDGGYTQKDVTEVARALTGWTIHPKSSYRRGGNIANNILEKLGPDVLEKRGYVFEGDFMFRADKHDEKEKNILGVHFPEGGGYAEGMRVLEILSVHPSTAAFICKKLAIRFVSDTPSVDMVKKMTATFIQTKGDIKSILTTMVGHVDFWKSASQHEKVKSPFELVISTVRATNADIKEPFQLFNWCTRMGHRFYYYQAPTGFPDRAGYWINTGSLLNRMNFGLAFATNKIPGIKVDWTALNNHHEPESIEHALAVFSSILLPGRDQEANIKRLLPLVKDENISAKIAAAAEKKTPEAMNNQTMMNSEIMADDQMPENGSPRKKASDEKAGLQRKALAKKTSKPFEMPYSVGTSNPLANVAGIIIGSPEFQRK